MKLNGKSILIIAGVIVALILAFTKCDSLQSGLSLLDKAIGKCKSDTIWLKPDTVVSTIVLYKDTCLNGLKLEDLSKKSRTKINRILRKDINEIPKLYPIDLITPSYTIDSTGSDSISLKLQDGTIIKICLPLLSSSNGTIPIWYLSNVPLTIDSVKSNIPIDSIIDSPKRFYYSLPVECTTKSEMENLRKYSAMNLNAIGGIDARGYIYGGLLLRSKSGFGVGFYVSSGRYNGLQIQVPIKRFR